MTWEQITINCPCCGESVKAVRALTHIRHLCGECGGFYVLTDDLDPAGLPIPQATTTPEELSRRAEGGWRGLRGMR